MRFLILFSIILATGVSANDITYTVALPNSEFYPQYSEDNNHNAQGLLPTIIKKFSSDEKISLRFTFLPIKRYMEYLKKGEVDFILPDNKDWGLEHKKDQPFTYSDEIMSSRSGVIVKAENKNIKISELTSLGTISGYSIHEFEQQKNENKLKVSYNSNPINLLKQVAIGRIQGAYLHVDIALYLSEQQNLKLVMASNLPSSNYSYHLSTIKHRDIIVKFNQWLKKNQPWMKTQKKAFLGEFTNTMLMPFFAELY